MSGDSQKRCENSPHSNSALRETWRKLSCFAKLATGRVPLPGGLWECAQLARRVRASSRRSSNRALHSAQRKPVICGFPQTQSHELLIETIINLWPKRAHDVFACRRSAAKILRFQIEMAILPGFQ
jgi:hypothetical protein